MKYVIMYGFPAHFASSDNLDVLGAPHCVSGKHRFTDMWKYVLYCIIFLDWTQQILVNYSM